MKILISIVSYREKELLNTVKSFYDDASNKDNLLFSIVSQDDEHPDLSFIDHHCLKYTQIHWKDTLGVNWARHIAQKAFTEFDYYLQLDSHMFSEKDWDIKLIDSFNKAKSLCEKPVLTCYSAMYRIEDGKRIIGPAIRNGCSDISSLTWSQGIWPQQRSTFTDIETNTYINAAVVFSTKEFVDAVPYDPDLTFFHEELCLTLRAEAAGFTSVCISSPIFYHFYAQDRVKAGRNYNPLINEQTLDQLVEHQNINVIHNKEYSKKVLSGESTGQYAISKDTLKNFCEKNNFTIKP
jgi:hypothetical protein